MALTKIGATLGGSADVITVTQNSHGLTLGYPVKMGSNGNYAHATADATANADAIGIIIATTTNTLTIAFSGRITVDGCVPNVTAGTVLFLQVSAGLLAAAEPDGNTQVSKPMAVVTIANSEMILVQQRGEVISTGSFTVGDGSITLAKMSTNSVDSDQYVDGSIDTAHLANQAVTNLKIADNTVSALNLASGSVGESQLATDAVTNAKVADDTIGVAELSATGTASSSTFLRGDNAWAAASSALQSTVTYGSRTAAAGSESVSYTGAGFQPTAVLVVAQGNTQDNISFGFGDDANGEQAIFARAMNGTHVMERADPNLIVGIVGSDSQKAALTSLDSDGMTLAWTKAGSGEAVNFIIMYLR